MGNGVTRLHQIPIRIASSMRSDGGLVRCPQDALRDEGLGRCCTGDGGDVGLDAGDRLPAIVIGGVDVKHNITCFITFGFSLFMTSCSRRKENKNTKKDGLRRTEN